MKKKYFIKSLLVCLFLFSCGQVWGQVNLRIVVPDYGTQRMYLMWTGFAGATEYQVRRRINSGPWSAYVSAGVSNIYNDTTALNTTDTIYFQVEAKVGGVFGNASNIRGNYMGEVWPVTKNASNTAAASRELLNGFHQPIKAGGAQYLHEGCDIHGEQNVSKEAIRSPLGAWLWSAGGSGSDVSVNLSFRKNNQWDNIQFNHCDSPLSAAVRNAASNNESVMPGQSLGQISSSIWNQLSSHTHFHHWLDFSAGQFYLTTNDPHLIFKQAVNLNPKGKAPEVGNTNSIAGAFDFMKGPHTSNFFAKDTVWKETDILVECFDRESADAPFQAPRRIGYFIQEKDNSTWKNKVKSAAAPYVLIDDSLGYLQSWSDSVNVPVNTALNYRDANTKATKLATHADYAWSEWFDYIVTNCKGTNGSAANLDRNQCFATDAIDTSAADNGYRTGYTRARSIDEAKFPDNTYRVGTYLADYTSTAATVYHEFVVDNFQPYVKKIKIQSGEMDYEAQWTWDKPNNKLAFTSNNDTDSVCGDVIVEIEMSEAMQFIQVAVPTIGWNSGQITSPVPVTNRKKWKVTIPSDNVAAHQASGPHHINITGNDLAGTTIMGFPSKSDYSGNSIPKHKHDETWDPAASSSTDNLYVFYIDSVPTEVTLTKEDVECFGDDDGSITASASGSYAPYTFSKDGTNFQGSPTFTDLEAGNYTIVAKDGVGCRTSKDTIVKEPPELLVSIGGGGVEFFCIQDGPGTMTLTAAVSGGTPPYDYSWPGGNKTVSSGGIYTCNVTDDHNCQEDASAIALFIPVVCSRDPNDMIGPEGFGPERWVSINDILPYTIRFENDPDFATAPAQKVDIRHAIPDKINIFSLRLSDFGFANMIFNVPPNSTYYSGRLDVRDSLGVYVDVLAGIDVSKHEAFWVFQAIDPATGLPPVDPLKGVLPVNDTLIHDGEGYVSFTVRPKTTANTGDSIIALAEIIFDQNGQINTPPIFNIIDALPPSSELDSLPSIIDSSNILISWSAEDDLGGSGVRDYELFYAKDGGSFTSYQKNIEDTSVIFLGNLGSTYDFFTLATDNTGNQEPIKTAGEETVLLINTDSIPPIPGFVVTNGCSNDSISFEDTSSISFGSIASWLFDFGDGTTASFSSAPGNFKHKYSTSGTYDVKLVATSAKGKRDSLTQQVMVYANPNASFTAVDICNGDSVTFVNNSTGPASSYSWDFGDNNSDTIRNPKHLYATTGTYTIKLALTSSNGCIDSASRNVSVHPQATASFMANSVCDGDSVAFIDQSSGPVNSYQWMFGDANSSASQNPKHLYTTPGSFLVKLIVSTANGCVDSSSSNISVYANPSALFSANTVCNGDTTRFIDSSSGNISSYYWDFNDGNNASIQSPSHLYSDSGSYLVKLVITNTNGCSDSIIKNTIVNPSPVANFTFNNVCDGDTVNFSNTSSGSITGYNWRFGDNTTASLQNPGHLYSGSGSYDVQLLVSNGYSCSDSITKNVSVYSNPVAGISGNDACLGDSTTFINNSTGSISNYLWNFGDTTTANSQVPKHLYSYSGSYTVKLLVTTSNGCTDSSSTNVDVYPVPTANYSAGNVCDGDSISFTNTSSGGISSYAWNFGDGNTSTSQNPKHLYSTSGSYNVKLIVTNANSCQDSVTKNVSIYANPAAGFTVSNSCIGDSTAYTNTSSGSISSYLWNFGDNTTSTASTPKHLYATTGTFSVKLIVRTSNGCVDSMSQNVQIFARPSANFSVSKVCEGDSTSFTNSSSGSIANYLWRFGDNTTSTIMTPKHLYASSGSYNSWLIVENSNGCLDSINRSVTVHATPSAGFSALSVCDGDSMHFNDTSLGSVTNYLWNFGDNTNSSLQNPVHLYSTSGNYSVKLIVETANGCKDSMSRNMAVFANPVADFTFNTVCESDSTAFTDASSGSISGYDWDFGDNTSSSLQSPIHLYSTHGNYNTKLVVVTADGCYDSTNKSVPVYEKPLAKFSWVNGCDGDSISFRDSSTGPASVFSWKFGDGTTGSIQNPNHLYATSGNYNVTQVISSVNGCIDSVQHSIDVYPNPLAFFVAPDGCFGDSTHISNQSLGSIASYNWDLGDGTISSDSSPVHLYATSGHFQVMLNLVSTDGCTDSLMDSLQIFDKPVAGFTVAAVCEGDSSRFMNNSSLASGTLSYAWDFKDGNTSADSSPVHLFLGAGSYQVSLITTTGSGCIDSFTTQATVHPPAMVAIDTIGSTGICESDSVILKTDKPFAAYRWTTLDTVQQITVHDSGTYSVLVTDSNGCQAQSQSVTISVEPSPKPLIMSNGPLEFCAGDSVRLDAGAGYDTYLWNTSDTTQSLLVTTSGSFYVDVESARGCKGRSDTVEVVEHPLPMAPVIYQQGDTLFASSFAQYQWYKDGNVIPGATDSFLVGSGNGSYTVLGTDTNGCSVLSQPFIITAIGDRIGNHLFSVYPNPGDGYFNFEAELGREVKITVTLLDALGKVEYHQEMGTIKGKFQSNLNFRNMAAGMYFLKVQAGTDVWTRKLIIQ